MAPTFGELFGVPQALSLPRERSQRRSSLRWQREVARESVNLLAPKGSATERLSLDGFICLNGRIYLYRGWELGIPWCCHMAADGTVVRAGRPLLEAG